MRSSKHSTKRDYFIQFYSSTAGNIFCSFLFRLKFTPCREPYSVQARPKKTRMGEQFTSIKDIKPGQKNINIMFIVLDIGIFNYFHFINMLLNFIMLIIYNET